MNASMSDSAVVAAWLADEICPQWSCPPGDAVNEGRRRVAALDADARAAVADELRQLELLDAVPLELQQRLRPDPIFQRERLVDGAIHTITDVRLPGASMEAVRRAVFDEPWSWWDKGRISGWTRTGTGGIRFVLWPAWLRSPARVGIDLERPEEQACADGRRRVVATGTFFADFTGPGRYEIVEGSGTVRLRSVWDGVRRQNLLKLLPATMVSRVHVHAERGTLTFPFPAGTGFGGLGRHLGLAP
jgi:hypothetical protein